MVAGAVWGLLGILGDLDFAISLLGPEIERPNVINWIVDPPAWAPAVVFILGVAVLIWDRWTPPRVQRADDQDKWKALAAEIRRGTNEVYRLAGSGRSEEAEQFRIKLHNRLGNRMAMAFAQMERKGLPVPDDFVALSSHANKMDELAALLAANADQLTER